MQYHHEEKHMGKREKLVQKWLTNPPKDAPVDQVEAILRHYFRDKLRTKTGSHRVVRDERLAIYAGFEPNGQFSIAIKGGQRVLGCYLQTLARAIQIIEEIEGL
jgi:hypothetical protein